MRIAIADDDSEIIEFLGRIVENQGHVYAGFADGTSLSSRVSLNLVQALGSMGQTGARQEEPRKSFRDTRRTVVQ